VIFVSPHLYWSPGFYKHRYLYALVLLLVPRGIAAL
jgi:hypothetical protein